MGHFNGSFNHKIGASIFIGQIFQTYQEASGKDLSHLINIHFDILLSHIITSNYITNSNLVYFRQKISLPFVEILIQMRYHDKNYNSNLIL